MAIKTLLFMKLLTQKVNNTYLTLLYLCVGGEGQLSDEQICQHIIVWW